MRARSPARQLGLGPERVRELGRGRGTHIPPPSRLKRPNSIDNVAARARDWTRVRYLSSPRNEGVPGSSPGVGFSLFSRLPSALATRHRGCRVRNGYMSCPEEYPLGFSLAAFC